MYHCSDCGSVHPSDAYRAICVEKHDALIAKAEERRKVLEQVEWVVWGKCFICAWYKCRKEKGHDPDCMRQQALRPPTKEANSISPGDGTLRIKKEQTT